MIKEGKRVAAETIKFIPMDWDKDLTMENVKNFQKWMFDIKLSF